MVHLFGAFILVDIKTDEASLKRGNRAKIRYAKKLEKAEAAAKAAMEAAQAATAQKQKHFGQRQRLHVLLDKPLRERLGLRRQAWAKCKQRPVQKPNQMQRLRR